MATHPDGEGADRPPVQGADAGSPRSRRSRFAGWILRMRGWTVTGSVPRQGIVIGAPHTSNWDFILTVLVLWIDEITPRVLVKSEAFWWPLGSLLRAVGAIETDRGAGGGLVARLTEAARGVDSFVLVLAPDGTRRPTDHWKSGFYRLSLATGLPVGLAFVDGPRRTVGLGPTITLTGDMTADMDVIRAFYADKPGLRPGRGSAIRLREEPGYSAEG